jgi:hypothetical protein
MHGASAVLTEYDPEGGYVSALSFKIAVNGQPMGFRLPCDWRPVLEILTKGKRKPPTWAEGAHSATRQPAFLVCDSLIWLLIGSIRPLRFRWTATKEDEKVDYKGGNEVEKGGFSTFVWLRLYSLILGLLGDGLIPISLANSQ